MNLKIYIGKKLAELKYCAFGLCGSPQEMERHLRALTDFPEGQGSLPSTHMVTICNSSYMGLVPSSVFLRY